MSESVKLMMWSFTIEQSFGDAFAKRSVLCICSSVSRQSAVNDFGVGVAS